MQSIQPEQARFLLDGVYGPALQNEHRITAGIVAAIPVDRSDYRPNEISPPALNLAWHTLGTESRFMRAICAGAFELTPNPLPDSIKNSADLSVWYRQEFEKQYAELAKLSDEQLMKIIDFRGMFQMPAVMYLGFMLHHTIHHRGQLSTYLRPMGAKVPAMYGESHDSAEAKKAQA